MLDALERHLGLPRGTIKVYVLVEQVEACFQLMEIRAALGAALRRLQHRPLGLHQQRLGRVRVGPAVRQPEHRRHHDDLRLHAGLRGPRAPRREHARSPRPLRALAGRHGAEHPRRLDGGRRRRAWSARSPAPSASSARAPAASGSLTGRWSTSSGRSGRRRAAPISSDASSRRSRTRRRTPTACFMLEPAPRTIRGARDLISVALQYGNAFGRGFQAAALKPADFFGNDDVLYLMEDMATGEIRLSILWEWVHKGARLPPPTMRPVSREGDAVHPGALPATDRGGVREAAARRQSRRARRLEAHDAADRAGDRRRPTLRSR